MRIFGFLFISLFVIFNSSISFSYNVEPDKFVNELVNDAINKLSDKNTTDEEKKKFIEKIATENVDIKALGLYTLGEIRKTAEENDLENYQNKFKRYFLKSLTSRLSDYSERKLIVVSSDKKNVNYTIVKTKVTGDNKQPEIKIDWRVYTKNPEKPLIRDLIVEGLSLARTQKEEFGSILSSNNNDINVLITKLEEFIKEN